MTVANHRNRRVLVVEDNVLISLTIQHMLESLGWTIVGTSASLTQALEMAKHLELDFAVLDLGLGEDSSYPVADALLDRSVPFLISTGQTASTIPARFSSVVQLRKPFRSKEFAQAVEAAVSC